MRCPAPVRPSARHGRPGTVRSGTRAPARTGRRHGMKHAPEQRGRRPGHIQQAPGAQCWPTRTVAACPIPRAHEGDRGKLQRDRMGGEFRRSISPISRVEAENSPTSSNSVPRSARQPHDLDKRPSRAPEPPNGIARTDRRRRRSPAAQEHGRVDDGAASPAPNSSSCGSPKFRRSGRPEGR